MMKGKNCSCYLSAVVIFFSVLFFMCDDNNPSDDDKIPVLDNDYLGALTLLFSQTMPPFSSADTMNVTVDKYGRMCFNTGLLVYEGDTTYEDTRLRQSGTVNLAPTGAWADESGRDRFDVVENGAGTNLLEMWGFDGTTWVKLIDQTSPITWNGGLAFYLDDAVAAGSVVQSTTAFGTVRWTLMLSPVY